MHGSSPGALNAPLDTEAALPQLQATAFGLLGSLLRVAGPALLPMFASVSRLLGDQLRRAGTQESPLAPVHLQALPRTHLYQAAVDLIGIGGAPAASALAPQALQCIQVELYGRTADQGDRDGLAATAEALAAGGTSKKRKKDAAGAAPLSMEALGLEGPGSSGSLPEGAMEALAQALANEGLGTRASFLGFAAQKAALQLLGALLRSAGAVLGPEPRAAADTMAAHAAATAARAAQGLRRSPHHPSRAALKVLQAAAYDTLLASVLSPCPHRPRFLPAALRLFREGLRDPDASVASCCSRGVAAIEPLLHPRDLPLALHPGATHAARLRVANDSHAHRDALESAAPLPAPRMWFQMGPPAPVREIQPMGPDASAANNHQHHQQQQQLAAAAGHPHTAEVLAVLPHLHNSTGGDVPEPFVLPTLAAAAAVGAPRSITMAAAVRPTAEGGVDPALVPDSLLCCCPPFPSTGGRRSSQAAAEPVPGEQGGARHTTQCCDRLGPGQ